MNWAAISYDHDDRPVVTYHETHEAAAARLKEDAEALMAEGCWAFPDDWSVARITDDVAIQQESMADPVVKIVPVQQEERDAA